jgi:hypothetical protein
MEKEFGIQRFTNQKARNQVYGKSHANNDGTTAVSKLHNKTL